MSEPVWVWMWVLGVHVWVLMWEGVEGVCEDVDVEGSARALGPFHLSSEGCKASHRHLGCFEDTGGGMLHCMAFKSQLSDSL